MNQKQKKKKNVVIATRAFIEHFAAAVGAATEEEADEVAARFPEPTGLGTDGTCWSVEEHRAYLEAVCKRALLELRKCNRLVRPSRGLTP